MSAPRSYGSLFTSENSPGVSGVSREYKHKFSPKFSSSNHHAEPLVLSKKCAIILPNDEATTVDKYFIAVGEIVGFKNIVYGGKTGQRMIMHLMNEELVESFIQDHDHVLINGEKFPVKKLVNPGFKILFNHVNPSITNDVLYAEISKYAHPVSPMTYVHSGLRDERLSHIFSYRRQIFVQDKDAVPNSITVTQNGETNTIYLTVDNMKCYSCGQEGHAVRMCPNRSQHPAQDRLTKEPEVVKTPELQDKVSPPTSSSSSPDLFAPSFFPELKQPTISFSPPANIDLFQESELKPLDGNIPSETMSTQDLTPVPSADQSQADELPNEPMEQDEKKRAKRVHPSVEATNNMEKKESHLKEEENFILKGFNTVRNDFTGGEEACGGVAILIKSNLYFQDLPIRSHLQVVAAVVHVSPIHPISVCSIYIPPNVSPSKEDLLDIINQLPRPFILCGDFNAHSPLWGSRHYNPRGKALEAIILLEEIHVLNKFECPTYLHPGSGSESVIDFTLCNSTLAPKLEWNVYPQDSDHHPIVISFCINPTPETNFLPKWKLNKADWAKFTALAEFSIDENLSVQEQVQEFTNKLLFAATESIPKSKPMNKKYAVAWWNEKCYLAIKERNKAFRVFTKTKSLDNWIAFKRLRAKVKRTVIQSKKESWISFASTITSSTPSTIVWDRIKRIEGNGRSSSVIKSIKVDNKTILVPNEIAHNIGLYFEQKSKERKESFPIAPQTWDFSSDNEERYNKPFSMWELESVLKLLKTQSSPGPDEIHNLMLRHLPSSTKSLLLKIFNKIWKEDEFPEGWKKSILVPIPKPNKDSTLPENLRPINLTSCLCKLFERIVVRRLNYFLDSNKLLVPQQSGCRKNRSTLDNLVNLQTDISNAIINKQFLLCTFFDIKFAYDCTQKEVILRQLHKWNMRGHLPIFLSKYMDPRSFKIRLNNSTLSEDFSIVCGIPQGGVVSGTLFAIAINSITSYIHPSLSSSLFVDDFAIFTRDKNKEVLVSIMQESIDQLENFSNDTGLFFSPQKTQSVLFSRKYKQNNTSINLKMYDTRIEVVDTFKFLGLTFDKKMTWKTHLKKLKQSCLSRSRILKILSKKAWAADRKMLIRIYKSLIRSKLDYGCPVYNSASSNSLQILNPVQNLCLRLATGAFRSSPVVSLEAETGEPNLDIRRKILSSNYIAKTLSIENHPNIMRTLNPLYVRKYENSNMKPTIGIQKKNLETTIPFNNIMVKTTPKEPWLLKKPRCDLSLSLYKKENVPAQVFQNEFRNKMSENFQSHIKIYTDGSKNEQGVGCALTIPEKDIVKRFGLNKNASIFHAELFALLQSLLTIKHYHEHVPRKSPGQTRTRRALFHRVAY
ncbi:hypothetical protein M8J77_025578 [Diaphorina citri]|nr:hypothetical protein M8J77_025578 [Diaphorina citri]